MFGYTQLKQYRLDSKSQALICSKQNPSERPMWVYVMANKNAMFYIGYMSPFEKTIYDLEYRKVCSLRHDTIYLGDEEWYIQTYKRYVMYIRSQLCFKTLKSMRRYMFSNFTTFCISGKPSKLVILTEYLRKLIK